MSKRVLEQVNYLYQNKFLFQINRIKQTNFYVQSANIPGISVGFSNLTTPNASIKDPFGSFKTDPLVISFIVDEQMANYLEIHKWLYGTGIPQYAKQYKDLKENTNNESLLVSPSKTQAHTVSDISLLPLNSANNAMFDVSFKNAFPVSITSLDFIDTNTSPEPVVVTATFEYEYYTIERI